MRESVSRRLPDDERGHKRSSDDNIDDSDRRESISRRLPDDDGRPEHSGAPVQHSPDEAGAIAKKSVRWNSKVEEFESQAAWGGAKRDMASVREKLGCKYDVSKFYSPPRVVKMARTLGMKGGVSLDLTVPASDGYIWDFSRKHCRDEALEIVDTQKALFLMFSPECMLYSNIQNLNMRSPAGKAKVEEARRRGDVHLIPCTTLAHKQMEGGRYFVYEHPKSAASCDNPSISRFASTPGVLKTE